jgi:hypothetical protein
VSIFSYSGHGKGWVRAGESIFWSRSANVGQGQRAVAGHGGHILTKSGFIVFSQFRLSSLL